MRLTDFLIDIGRPVAYYPDLTKITGSVNASIFLCQLIYWTGKESENQGWIYKTSEEIKKETGLSYEEQKTARRKLKVKELLDEEYRRLEHRIYYKVNQDKLNELWMVKCPEKPEKPSESGNPSLANMGKSNSGMRESLTGEQGNPSFDNNVSKITSEITLSPLPLFQENREDGCEDEKLRERVLEEFKKYFPQLNSIPQYIPVEKVDYLIWKIEKGDIKADSIKNPLAYLKKMDIVEKFPLFHERRAEEINRQKKVKEKEAERSEKEKRDKEYYEEAERKIKSLSDEEIKRIERLARESLSGAVKNISAIVKSKMYEIVMASGP